MNRSGQHTLFDDGPTPGLPEGFEYRAEFMSHAEEQLLLQHIAQLPLQEASYHQWTARRRIVSYGGRYDFSAQRLDAAEPIPRFLYPLRERLAEWIGVSAAEFGHGVIAEYRPGTQLGWHRDVPEFEIVAGVSLAGAARMRFRPYPPAAGVARATCAQDLLPRSAYVLRGKARWGWQHAISPTRELRYSITLRTCSTRGVPAK